MDNDHLKYHGENIKGIPYSMLTHVQAINYQGIDNDCRVHKTLFKNDDITVKGIFKEPNDLKIIILGKQTDEGDFKIYKISLQTHDSKDLRVKELKQSELLNDKVSSFQFNTNLTNNYLLQIEGTSDKRGLAKNTVILSGNMFKIAQETVKC